MKEEALKLAEIFEEVGRAKYPYHLDAAEMLRRLVEELDYQNTIKDSLRQQLAEKLEELDKQGEPVVWMYQDKSTHEVRFQKHMRGFVDHGKTYETPLYTAPQTKPLSDKEITQVFDKCYPNNGDGDVVTLIDFARAIEERHGIK